MLALAPGMFSPYEPANDAERATLEASWAHGTLQRHLVRLLEFIDRHRDDLRTLATDPGDPLAIAHAMKRLIIHLGTVHHRSEMDDQVRAIHDEIWICGERGSYDREFIKHDWTSRHASNWRRWRIKEYLFVVDHSVGAIFEGMHHGQGAAGAEQEVGRGF